MANNMPAQNEPIRLDMGDMVLISFNRFNSLITVEADKERYAQHIIEHQKNLSTAEARINELENSKSSITQDSWMTLTTKYDEAVKHIKVLESRLEAAKVITETTSKEINSNSKTKKATPVKTKKK